MEAYLSQPNYNEEPRKPELGKTTDFQCRFTELTTFKNIEKAPVRLDLRPGYLRAKRPTEKKAACGKRHKNDMSQLDYANGSSKNLRTVNASTHYSTEQSKWLPNRTL